MRLLFQIARLVSEARPDGIDIRLLANQFMPSQWF